MAAINLFNTSDKKQVLIVVSLGVLFFFPFLGYVHLFDWDEINFAESSREMLVSKDIFHVQINYLPFWEKPPLFMWLQSLSMAVFGVNEFAARFPNALFGIITLITFYKIGKKYFSNEIAIIWPLIYLASFLPHIYFKSGIIDPVFNYFIFISIFYLTLTINEAKNKFAILSGVFTGLAILTKGPVGLLLVVLTYIVYLLVTKFNNRGKIKHILIYMFCCIGMVSIWVLPEVFKNGFATLYDFINYQIRLLTTGDAGHEQPFYYHFLVVFVGCFPMSVFSVALFKPSKFNSKLNFTIWMVILFWVVLILFTIVKTKIVHYSSMCWIPMSFVAAVFLAKCYNNPPAVSVMKFIYFIVGILFSFILIGVPLAGYFKNDIIPLIKDKFAADSFSQQIDWPLWLCIIGIIYLSGIIFGYIQLRKGELHGFVISQSLFTGFVLFGAMLFIVPRIERHSQAPAINFFKNLKGRDVYVLPVGYKSYAHYFYFEIPNNESEQRVDESFLLYGKIDKPAYFITKTNSDFLDNREEIKQIGKEGGFKFYLRNPK